MQFPEPLTKEEWLPEVLKPRSESLKTLLFGNLKGILAL